MVREKIYAYGRQLKNGRTLTLLNVVKSDFTTFRMQHQKSGWSDFFAYGIIEIIYFFHQISEGVIGDIII